MDCIFPPEYQMLLPQIFFLGCGLVAPVPLGSGELPYQRALWRVVDSEAGVVRRARVRQPEPPRHSHWEPPRLRLVPLPRPRRPRFATITRDTRKPMNGVFKTYRSVLKKRNLKNSMLLFGLKLHISHVKIGFHFVNQARNSFFFPIGEWPYISAIYDIAHPS